jgi:superfamily II DNA or RNA helicase
LQAVTGEQAWATADGQLVRWISDHRRRVVDSYRANPYLIEEHGRQEDAFRTGGYAHRQVLELVQNAADALRRGGQRGRVEILLAEDTLYCANEGEPFTEAGLEAVCHAYLSDKRGDEIGRFGLGFKSVLGITDEPAIFSRSVSFGFRASHSRSELAHIDSDVRNFPVLRLPFLIEAEEEFENDPVLAQLASWASTVVRLPVSREMGHLLLDLHKFPHEFLLFAPYVASLTIAGSGEDVRVFRCEHAGNHRRSLVGMDGSRSEWMVWDATHMPSEEALQEVGEAIRRPEVTVSYAAPLDDAMSLGRFWAYFPLQDLTSARGIHNAPWRVNDDRTNLMEGKFNEELLGVLADLIVGALPSLKSPGDPARHFDYLPARGREAQYFGDKRLCVLVPAAAARVACVPDSQGVLRFASDLEYADLELRLEPESYRLWASSPGRPILAPHWSCYATLTRRARLRTLIRHDEAKASDVEIPGKEWLESIVASGTDEQCDVALRVVFSVKDEPTRRSLLAAAVLPDVNGRLARLDQTSDLFLRGNPLSNSAGLSLVRPSFLARPNVEARLRSLGFVEVDPTQELLRLSAAATAKWGSAEWKSYWDLVLEVPLPDAEEILLAHLKRNAVVKVRCRDMSWQHVGTVVVAGLVEPTDPSVVLDDVYHEDHASLLHKMGVSVRPTINPGVLNDMTLLEYQRLKRAEFLEDLPARGRPDPSAINWREGAGPGPLHVLRRFADSGDLLSQALWTRELLEIAAFGEWTLWWATSKGRVYEKSFPAPHVWAADTYGLVESAWGPRPPRQTLHPGLARYSPLLPVARWTVAERVSTIGDLGQVSVELWREYLERTPEGGSAREIGVVSSLAMASLPRAEVPDRVPVVRMGTWDSVPPEQAIVATTDDEARALREQGLPFFHTDAEQAEIFTERWGCLPAASVLRVDWVADTPSEPVLLLDRFRRLRDYGEDRLDDVSMVSCSALLRVVTTAEGTDSYPQDFAVTNHTVNYQRTLSPEEVLERISHEFDLGIDVTGIQRILHAAESEKVKAAVAACRVQNEVPDKLLALLPVESLETALPAGLLKTVRDLSGDDSDRQVAELLSLVHGYSALNELKYQLEEAGYDVPKTWAGSSPAIAFVQSLGFPAEYAGERGGQLAPDMTVLGPPNLNPLHDYQVALARQIQELVTGKAAAQRGLLFLPTGAGKTRVTVQALAESITHEEISGPVLWIAQTEELCEQAVQTWSTVWRELGDRPLRLCRLWGDNHVGTTDADASVIVATDAKLASIRGQVDYEWLRDTAVVVIDEAHGATGTGVTATLKWLGIEGRKTARPLLGLTATPFKGRGEEANQRLATRFGSNLLNALGDDPYGQLQELGVLARVEHSVLEGSTFSLDVNERRDFERYQDLPSSVLERVGRDQRRTLRLLDHICGQPEEWPILVFTSSVLAAQTLSALLRVRGVASGTVSGSTPIKERRRTIEAFRNMNIQVLTNCNVLTQGFDAPGVRALYIARPTFSPNAYIQMVGRGLRGPANGGKEQCLIVNVQDTFEAFGEALAYREFEYLWREQGGVDS